MPRNVTASFRQAAESSFSDEVDLVFLTITHPTLSEPIRLNWDTKDFVYDGATFTGFPFDIELLSDDEGPPTARLQIQNIDPRIGDTIRMLTTPPRLKIELLSSADFDLTVDPRVELAGSGDNLGVLLLHCDGLTGSTTFTDSSGNGHVITLGGTPAINATQGQFDGAAIFGGGDYLILPSSSDWVFGTGDFTIDMWARFSTLGTAMTLYSGNGIAGTAPYIYKKSDDKLYLTSSSTDRISGTTTLSANTFYHVALARSGTSTKLFLDGVQEGSTFVAGTNWTDGTATSALAASNVGANSLGGRLDEIRIIKGTAAWTTAFTPPIAPYAAAPVTTVVYSADRLFLTNVSVDVLTISGQIVGWDYVQRVWPGKRATQDYFPGLFR